MNGPPGVGGLPGEAQPPPARPVSIVLTVACAFAGLIDLQLLAYAFSREFRQALAAHPWGNAVLAAIAILQLVALVTLWRGRKAGLFGFVALAAIHNLVLVVVSRWGLCALVPPAVVAAAGAWNWERLR